jgi:transcriptional regulator with XRE-family HTH domain
LEKSQRFSRAVVQELRRLRKQKGWSQLALATRAGVSRGAVQHIEKGIRNPTLMLTHALAEALDVSLCAVVKKCR